MYLDNSLNKLLPSCLLLPLLLRVISVLIVFLSIWSHCFSGLFLCYFLSTKINYKYPFELGAGDVQTQQSGIPPAAKSAFLLLLYASWLNVQRGVQGVGHFMGLYRNKDFSMSLKAELHKIPHAVLWQLSQFVVANLAWEMGSAQFAPWLQHSSSMLFPLRSFLTPGK